MTSFYRLTETLDKWYHCTNEENAKHIETNGFSAGIDNPDYFEEYYDQLIKFLGSLANNVDDATELEEVWHKNFPGAVIWLSENPETTFGDVCFEVKLPPGTREIIYDYSYGTAFYYPKSIIPPKYFRRIN